MRELLVLVMLGWPAGALAGTLHFERDLPAPVDEVWPLISDPVQMNTWSRAQVELVAPGPGGRPDEAGAIRRVTVRSLGVRSELMERVEAAEPPRRLVYTVTSGGGLKEHLGTVTLTPTAGGTHLTWHVEYRPKVFLVGWVLKAVVRPQLSRSLDDLEERLARP